MKKLYEEKERNKKFLLMKQLFNLKFNMNDHEISMKVYLRIIKNKLSELAAIHVTLDKKIRLFLIFNDIIERFRYLIVTLKQQNLDFDELIARLIEEVERYFSSSASDIVEDI